MLKNLKLNTENTEQIFSVCWTEIVPETYQQIKSNRDLQ